MTSLKPFVKWLGGKRKLAPFITDKFRDYNTYWEPFAGGGAVFLNERPKTAVISDVNKELILTYQVLQRGVDNLQPLFKVLEKMQQIHSEESYYTIRSWDRQDTYEFLSDEVKVARFLYLNRSGFNGVHRLNNSGHFNVPSGKRDKSSIVFDYENYTALHKYFSNSDITFECRGYGDSQVSPGDLVYLDPPYHKTYTRYHIGDFTEKDQEDLYVCASQWVTEGSQVVMSNNHTDLIIDLWLQDGLFEPYDPVSRRSVGYGYQADKTAREVLMVSV